MTWLDFTLIMADLAHQPGIVYLCFLLMVAAGTWAAFLVQEPYRYEQTDEAGDTHAHLDQFCKPGELIELDRDQGAHLGPNGRLIITRRPQ